ncbi:MAG: flagellar hook-basal body complex protein FliE [Planctomycetota bacterium]
MSDPLGLIGSGGVGPVQRPTSSPAAGKAEDGANFKDSLLANLKQADKLQADATQAVQELSSGQRSDVEGVILATQKADMAFQMLQSVRNKVMEAYDEIKQMRV